MFENFFSDPSFDFETRSLFGDIHYGAGDVGEMLTAVAAITDGEAESWVAEWRSLAERVEAIADSTSKAGHQVSARGAYLRAAVYYAASYVFVDGTDNADAQLTELFAAHRRCFDLHVGLLDPPAIPIAAPYEEAHLHGYLFTPAEDGVARPTLILNNGSDAAFTFLWPGLGKPGLDRGYNAVIFDGPGQQSMLFERGIPFRPDWEHVITPLVDYLSERAEVDASKIALYGTSQAGYWAPRAAAFEHRLAAWSLTLGSSMFPPRGRATFPRKWSICSTPRMKRPSTQEWRLLGRNGPRPWPRKWPWRAKPYGPQPSDYATFKAVEQYQLGDLVKDIRAPMMITDPEGEQFWPGQSQQLFDALSGTKVIVPFTKAEGADMHIEPMGRSLLEQRMYDWLDETLG
jgi:hypothetical protein